MNPFKKIKNYFIGKALACNEDPFDNVKVEVLFNFSLFFFVVNLPYTFISFSSDKIHLISAIVQNITLLAVIFILKKGAKLKLAINFFLFNFASQNILHFLINNGKIFEQSIVFFTLFSLFTFMLVGRWPGLIATLFICLLIVIGIYNGQSNYSLFKFPPEMADPTSREGQNYFIVLPVLLNLYLVSEFVRAQNKAKDLLQDQKKIVDQKNKEVRESIEYAKRIQSALITPQIYIERSLNKLNKN
jgi:hypothetical protein